MKSIYGATESKHVRRPATFISGAIARCDCLSPVPQLMSFTHRQSRSPSELFARGRRLRDACLFSLLLAQTLPPRRLARALEADAMQRSAIWLQRRHAPLCTLFGVEVQTLSTAYGMSAHTCNTSRARLHAPAHNVGGLWKSTSLAVPTRHS